eukprot:801803-Amphidinium_carterae.1
MLSIPDILTSSLAAFTCKCYRGMKGLDHTHVPATSISKVQVPDKIKSDPFELLSVDPTDKKQDRAEFYMKRNYKGSVLVCLHFGD